MELKDIIAFIASAVCQGGISALGKSLATAAIDLFKHAVTPGDKEEGFRPALTPANESLHAQAFYADPDACLQQLETIAANNPEFKLFLDSWAREVTPLVAKQPKNRISTDIHADVMIGNTITVNTTTSWS